MGIKAFQAEAKGSIIILSPTSKAEELLSAMHRGIGTPNGMKLEQYIVL